jgi:hypothetical protein
MKTRGFFLFFLFFIAANMVFSQSWNRAPISLTFLGKTYNKASLTYENGETKNCYVAIPKTCKQKEISVKTDKDSKVSEIQSQVLKMITVYNQDSSVYIFERVNYIQKPGDKPKDKMWLYVMEKGYATLYLKIDKYKIDKNGVLNFIADEGLPMNYIKKDGEKTAVLIAMTNPYPGANIVIGSNKPFEKYAPVFFKEDKELAEQIKKGQYTSNDIIKVVRIYNEFMAGK